MTINLILSLLLLCLPLIQGQSVADVIDSIQAEEPTLLDPISSFATSYQGLARSAAVGILRNSNNPTTIRNFYVLSCIYYATNGVANPRTEVVIPGCPVPTWTEDDWLFTTDYCTWHGVTCEGENVIWITLPRNNLHGSWPPEVVLLKEHLRRIDVSDNPLHYSNNPEWLSEMKELQHLYFGSTSWEYPGVPSELNGATQLVSLNMSDTRWSGGPLRPEAFSALAHLQTLDIGGNQYDTTDSVDFPLTSLPNLHTLYMSDCRFAPNLFDLSFLGALPSLVTAKLDLTRFKDAIPSTIGDLASLVTFSCSYCGLTGPIPNEFGNLVSLETLRLVGNDLTGIVPATLGNLLVLEVLYLEANSLDPDTAVPDALCDITSLQEFGVGCNLNCTCCTCCGEDCGNLVDPTAAPTPEPTQVPMTDPPTTLAPATAPPTLQPTLVPTLVATPRPTLATREPGAPFAIAPVAVAPVAPSPETEPPTGGGGGLCFSGDAEVEVRYRGTVQMKDLVLGDVIKVANDKYEPVYSFGHKNDVASADFLQIVTEGNLKPLHISPNHMLFVENGRAVPASTVKQGDVLLLASLDSVVVQAIRTVTRKGLYAPFTQSGTLIVNGIVASNYVSFQDSGYISISGYETPLTYQWVAHTFQSAQRLAVTQLSFPYEKYTDTGISVWVNFPHRAGSWLLEQNALVILLVLVPCIVFFGFLSIAEQLIDHSILISTILAGICVATMLLSSKHSYYAQVGCKK